jgi:site-specific recombinase XerD
MLKGNRIQPETLSAHGATQIVKHYAELAALDPARFAGHLRADFITSAAESGATLLRIADQLRHKSLDVLRD